MIKRAILVITAFSLICVIALFTAPCAQNAPRGDNPLLLLSRPHHHAILRHALAPGSGDPENFTLDDCSTQRNLGAAGRAQSVSLGEDFKAANVIPTQIVSSQWCRTMDTARLMDLGPVKAYAPLISIWTQPRAQGQIQSKQIIDMLSGLPAGDTTLMVTHSVNISALTGQGAPSGGGYVIKVENGQLEIIAPIGASW